MNKILTADNFFRNHLLKGNLQARELAGNNALNFFALDFVRNLHALQLLGK